MTVGAHFQINQATNVIPTGTTDVARIDIYQNQTVHFVGDSVGNASPSWTILSWSDGASRTQPSNATTFDATYTFVTAGSFRFEYLVNDGIGTNKKHFIVRVTRTSGGLIIDDGVAEPAFGEEVGDDNAGSNDRGYAKAFENGLSRQLPSIPDITTLRLRAGNRHKHIHLLGYYSANDGGGGIFYWDGASTTADDGGAVIQPTGLATGRWLRRFDSTALDVRWWGAKGNDVTHDDRPGIQGAIHYSQLRYGTLQTSGPSPNIRYSTISVYLPGGRTWYIGRAPDSGFGTNFNHGLELPGTQHLEGDKGTILTPRRVAVTASTSTDIFTATGHGFIVGEEILFTSGAGSLPGNVREATIYQVSATSFTANQFRIEKRGGGTPIDLITTAGSGASAMPAMATCLVECARFYMRGIQFVDGYAACVLTGNTSLYGNLSGFQPAEYVNTWLDCQFVNQAGPSIWQELAPVTNAGQNRSVCPLKFSHCMFRGPSAFWAVADRVDFSHCTFIWDQSQLNAMTAAALPESMYSSDGLPLGCVNGNINMFFDHCFIDPNQGIGGTSFPERRAFCVGKSAWSFNNVIWGELDGCLIRGKASGNGYRGLSKLADGSPNFDAAVGAAPLKITFEGACLFDTHVRNILEIYEQAPNVIRFGRADETNAGSAFGIWVDSGVAIADFLNRQHSELIIQSDYITGPIVRVRRSTETDGFAPVTIPSTFDGQSLPFAGVHPWGAPIANGTGIVDISGVLEQYWHNRPFDEWNVTTLPQENLWFTDIYDVTVGGLPATQVILDPGTQVASTSTNSDTGVALTTITSNSTGLGVWGFRCDKRWGATLPAGVYVFSLDMMATKDVWMTFQYAYSASQLQTATRRIVGDGRYRRYEFSFYFAGGGADYAFGGVIPHVPASATVSMGLFKIEKGRRATPYTAPVDVPATPTTNTMALSQPRVYWMTTVPVTGVYKVGDRIKHPSPAVGAWAEQTCTTASTTTAGQPVFRVTATAAANPSVADTAATLNLVTILNNGGSTVTAGDEVEFPLTITGAKFGDDAVVTALGYIGNKWDIYARISANDTVRVAIRNGTGSNAAIPTDATGGLGTSVTVTQHPPFETFFANPWAWLTGDTGYNAGTGDWTDQFGLNHNAGPQGTAAKRPTVGATLNGHGTLASTRANATSLATTQTLTAQSTVFVVVENSGSSSSYLLDATASNGISILYDWPGHSQQYEYLDNHNGGARRNISATGVTGWSVIGISINDAGNLMLYLNGAQVYNAAADGPLATMAITWLFSASNGTGNWNGRVAQFLVYHSAFNAAQMVDESARLKAKYGL